MQRLLVCFVKKSSNGFVQVHLKNNFHYFLNRTVFYDKAAECVFYSPSKNIPEIPEKTGHSILVLNNLNQTDLPVFKKVSEKNL